MTDHTILIQEHILQWFKDHGRDLPWRRTRDPYAIVVSEVMLQQTQVDRVLPKYHQFLETYPDVYALAKASVSELIAIWSPLGYNRRPLRLKAIAQAVVEQYQGIFPRTMEELLLLPGVGPYTAGAILCFAFEQDVAMVDTNIRRIVHRWNIGVDYPAPQISDKKLQVIAQEMVPQGHGYQWGQALMDFGSAICTSSNPRCDVCPVRAQCLAYPAITEVKKVRLPAKEKFTDSNRFYRGKTLRFLTAAEHHTSSLNELGHELKGLQPEQEAEWLDHLVSGLHKDQLVIYDRDKGQVSLPE